MFLLTAGLGLTLVLVPMEVRVPREGALAMMASLAVFAGTLWDGAINRLEGAMLVLVTLGLMVWLYRRSPVFQRSDDDDDDKPEADARGSRARAVGLLVAGVAVMVVGAEFMVRGVHTLLSTVRLFETFAGVEVGPGLFSEFLHICALVTAARTPCYPGFAPSTYLRDVRGSSPVRLATSAYVPRRR